MTIGTTDALGKNGRHQGDMDRYAVLMPEKRSSASATDRDARTLQASRSASRIRSDMCQPPGDRAAKVRALRK